MLIASKCHMCDKSGLPILLVREAIAPIGMLAPVSPNRPVELDPNSAHYTKRVLRCGYVNVYDEARDRWESYFVTVDGYFKRISNGVAEPPAEASKPFACPDRTHRPIAGCITVADPKAATNIWIGFSDVCWTEAVRSAHRERSQRARHMVCIDVKALMSGQVSQPIQPIGQVDQLVAEYVLPAARGQMAFDWSPFPFHGRFDDAADLKAACEKLRPKKGVIVTVADPAGVLQELAALMKFRMSVFLACDDDRMKLAACAAIDEIKRGVWTKAEYVEQMAAEHLAAEQERSMSSMPYGLTTLGKKLDDLRDVNSAEATKAAVIDWQSYLEKFDNSARLSWKSEFDRKFKSFDETQIAPLAGAHAKWMSSSIFADSLQCNFDRINIWHGMAYTVLLTECIDGTQDKLACSAVYQKMLSGDANDRNNILLQAALLNNDNIAKAAIEASSVNIDIRQLPWDNVFAIYAKSVEAVKTQARNILAKFIVQLVGPFAAIFAKLMSGTAGFRAAMIAAGLISGHPLVICEITGTKKEFRRLLVRELMLQSGSTVDWDKLDKFVAAELKRQQNRGVQLHGSETRRFIIVADHQIIKTMPAGMTPNNQAKWLASSLKSVDSIEKLHLARWKQLMNFDVGAGSVTGILQFVCLTKLFSDDSKSLANEKSDARGRLIAGLISIAATMSEVFEKLISNRLSTGMRYGARVAATSARVLHTGARWCGIGGAALSGFLDCFKAYESANEGQMGLAWLYGGSALLGGALTVAIMTSASIPVIGLLVILVIGIGILIEHVKDNPIQDWLERCPWGRLTGQRYKDLRTLEEQLKKATQ